MKGGRGLAGAAYTAPSAARRPLHPTQLSTYTPVIAALGQMVVLGQPGTVLVHEAEIEHRLALAGAARLAGSVVHL